MKVHVIVEIWHGLVEPDPVVYADREDAKRHFKAFCKEHDLPEDEPYNDDHEIHWYGLEVVESKLSLQAGKVALKRLNNIVNLKGVENG